MATDYASLTIEQLAEQYQAALDASASKSELKKFTDEFDSRGIHYPYIGQIPTDPVELSEIEKLRQEVEALRFSAGKHRSDSGLILPPQE